jgi:hypothetical protein
MNIDEIKEMARNSADKHEFSRECTEWHSYYYGFILGMQKALILPAVVKPLKEKREAGSYKCLLCGRYKFTHKQPHKCLGGFRKRKIPWQKLK